ncbi:DNA-processing protein DprA [Athalassotoga saccharophila]|uniref:DNA-processing protein DprA n=1 Tax=Athalassotoga saccharophila TaxID=1441386 RepID=UPI001379D167|nr:DNA-processing protein DprA [Athalassotoga saccharophila]BBJ27520.1 DNA processing protein DprA [Athalassotoga saccharophila]
MKLEEALSKILNRPPDSKDVRNEIKKCEDLGIELIPIEDERYPSSLAQIKDPPLLLYVKGKRMDALGKFAIAIVGSRMATSYGRNVAAKLSTELSRSGVVIVSGLAHGIDSVAHEEASKYGLTIGVLGTGIDIVYPRSKDTVFQKVMENGCLVSEFPLGTMPAKWTFPKRNRIIAGLSMGIIVVEASTKSGSLITARLGLEEGREIFAVPGSIFSPTSEGTINLIKHGAKCVTSAEDVLEEFGYVSVKSSIPEDPILDLLKGGPKSLEEIAIYLGVGVNEVNSRLTAFEIDGIVSKDFTDRFKLNL